MKKRYALAVISLICVFLSVCFSVTANAAETDTQATSSLKIIYQLNGYYYNDISVKSYKIAEPAEDGYKLSGKFTDYPVDIENISSQGEWDAVISTLSAYIAADKLTPDLEITTDENGTAIFYDVSPGLYLTLSVTEQTEKGKTVFESFIAAASPTVNGDEAEQITTVFPKSESFVPTEKEIEYKAVKQWKDIGYTDKRPSSVQIDILKNGVLQYTQKLSSENNWVYRWTAPDDGSVWQAVERRIPNGYTVTVTENSSTIIITNAYKGSGEKPPKTGDTTVLWPYIIAMCLSGGFIVIFSLWGRKGKV